MRKKKYLMGTRDRFQNRRRRRGKKAPVGRKKKGRVQK